MVDEDPKRKRTDLAKVGLASPTLSTTVGQRDITQNVQRFSADARKAKTARYVMVEDVLLTWFREVTAAVVNVDSTILLKKASDIALLLRVDDFQASSGCIHRFKTRHGLGYKTVSGEGKKVDESAVSNWMRSTLPSLIAGYEARNIFNADEAGVYYNLQLEKSLCFKGDACKAASA